MPYRREDGGPPDTEYQAGLRDGRLGSLEKMVAGHDSRLDQHSRRLALAEKILYGLIGALALINFAPTIYAVKELIGK
ncbi:MAG: hypothetical protein GY696_25150 [Gammaproteobacteria bacterium]|nr:hypothetical protein [Gammaproteobacteria bacterium]